MKRSVFLYSLILIIMLSNILPLFASEETNQQIYTPSQAVEILNSKGIMKGDSLKLLKPDIPITRAEFAALINRSFGFTKINKEIKFTDVKPSDWFYNDIYIAAAQGYLKGDERGRFNPKENVTREQAAVIIGRILKLPEAVEKPGLMDDDKISSWAAGMVSTVAKEGYIKGISGMYHPKEMLKREDAARILVTTMGEVYNKAEVYNESNRIIQGNATISKAGVVLKNVIIQGNLYITEGVGDGEVTLEGVTVKGKTLISGGGINSVVIINSEMGPVRIEVPDNAPIRLVAKGSTVISDVTAASTAQIQEEGISGSGIDYVYISVGENETVSLSGDFSTVEVRYPEAEISLKSGHIEDMVVSSNADNARINLTPGAQIDSIMLQAPAIVSGSGIIVHADINTNGVTIEQDVRDVAVKNGCTATVNGQNVTAQQNYTPAQQEDSDEKPVYTINVSSSPSIGGSTRGGGSYTQGSRVRLTAVPASGYEFKNWTVNDAVVSEAPAFIYTMPGKNVAIKANFAKLYTVYTKVEPVKGGTITEQGVFAEGDNVAISYTENTGYVFSHWKVNGQDFSADDVLTLEMPASDLTVIAIFLPILDVNVWDGTVASHMFRLTDGTYLIRTGAELAWISEQCNALQNEEYTSLRGAKFKLVNDIDLNNIPWTPIGLEIPGVRGRFEGTFMGGNKTIKNLKVDLGEKIPVGPKATEITLDSINVGLFGNIGTNGKVKDLKLREVNITSEARSNNIVGGLAGYNYGNITNCNVGGIINLSTEQAANIAGGIAGSNQGNIEQCFNTTRISVMGGRGRAAGIAGMNYGNIRKSFNDGGIYSNHYAAGIAADNLGLVENCFNANIVEVMGISDNQAAGGLVAADAGSGISMSYNSGKISAGSGACGGVVGIAGSQTYIYYCYYMAGTAASGVGQATGTYRGNAVPLTDEQMQDRANFADNFTGFNFIDVWCFADGYPPPHLKCFQKSSAAKSSELKVQVEPKEGGTATGEGTYMKGETVALSAEPAEGYRFKNWIVGGIPVSRAAAYNYKMPGSDVKVTANFELIAQQKYTLTVTTQGGGTVSGGGSYEEDQEIGLVAVPFEGYSFEKWTIKGESIGTSANMSFVMPAAATTIVGVFKPEQAEEPIKYTLTVQAEPEEGGSAPEGGSYAEGEEVSISAAANEGYQFENWTIDGEDYSEDIDLTYEMPARNVTLTAHFIATGEALYAVSLKVNPPAGGTVTGCGQYKSGETVLLQAFPSDGYSFISWKCNGTVMDRNKQFSFIMPDQDIEITANFAPACTSGDSCLFSGSGSADDPIEITNRAELEHINGHLGQIGLHYKLMNDISLSGENWMPIGLTEDEEGNALTEVTAFNGFFDGSGCTISDMTIDFEQPGDAYAGLFAYLNEGSISSLNLENVSISVASVSDESGEGSYGSGIVNAGGIAGFSERFLIEACSVTGSISLGSGYYSSLDAGGIVGTNGEGIIKNCRNLAAVSAGAGRSSCGSGGIAGSNSGQITGCINDGVITASAGREGISASGGISGVNHGTICSSYNKGSVNASGGNYERSSGGITGISYGTVLACYNMGNITVYADKNITNAGGLVGNNSGEITASYNSSSVENQGYGGTVYLGAIAGRNSQFDFDGAKITNCYAIADFTGSPGVITAFPGAAIIDNAAMVLSSGFLGSIMDPTVKYCPYCGATSVETLACIGEEHEQLELNAWIKRIGQYPVLRAFYEYTPSSCGHDDVIGAFTSGDGTAGNPYIVCTEYQLQHLAEHCTEDVFYKLTDDIYMQEEWQPIGSETEPFNGIFDGSGYAIKNLRIKETAGSNLYLGLFRVTGANSKIHNLHLGNINVQFDGADKEEQYYVGGITGENRGLIHSCSVSGALDAVVDDVKTGLGGIAGKNSGHIAMCYNASSITMESAGGDGASDAGGIAALNVLGIENCYNTGSVALTGGVENRGAGIAAVNFESAAEVRRCYNTGAISAVDASNSNTSAGIAANNVEGLLSDCYNNKDTSGQENAAPEFGIIERCGSLSDEQMKDSSSWTAIFTGFNWEEVWCHIDEYPYPALREVTRIEH